MDKNKAKNLEIIKMNSPKDTKVTKNFSVPDGYHMVCDVVPEPLHHSNPYLEF